MIKTKTGEVFRIKNDTVLNKLLNEEYIVIYNDMKEKHSLTRKESRRNVNEFINKIKALDEKLEYPDTITNEFILNSKCSIIQGIKFNRPKDTDSQYIMPSGNIDEEITLNNGTVLPNIVLVGEMFKDFNLMYNAIDLSLNDESSVILINPDISIEYIAEVIESLYSVKNDRIITVLTNKEMYTKEQLKYLEEISQFLSVYDTVEEAMIKLKTIKEMKIEEQK